MSVFDDPRGKLRWLEEELLEEETGKEAYEEEEAEEAFLPRTRRGRGTARAVYADERTITGSDALLVERKKRKVKGLRRLKFLAFLEVLGILAVVWWWIKWLY